MAVGWAGAAPQADGPRAGPVTCQHPSCRMGTNALVAPALALTLALQAAKALYGLCGHSGASGPGRLAASPQRGAQRLAVVQAARPAGRQRCAGAAAPGGGARAAGGAAPPGRAGGGQRRGGGPRASSGRARVASGGRMRVASGKTCCSSCAEALGAHPMPLLTSSCNTSESATAGKAQW